MKKALLILPLISFFCLSGKPELLQANSPNILDKTQLDQFVSAQMKRDGVPSAAVGIIQNGQVIHSKTYSNDKHPDSVTPQSVFFLGSTSKLITAAGIIKLEEQGKLKLSDQAYLHVSQPLANSLERQAPDLTISQLIEHTSGISQWSGYFNGKSELSIDHIAFSHQPGTTHEYSSMNYILLGKIIEHVSQMSYADFMRQEIFKSWGMSNTNTSLEAVDEENLVQAYSYLGYFPITTSPTNAPAQLVPMGYIASSVSDMSQFLVNFSQLEYISDKRINQAGMDRGYSSRIVWLPEDKLGIVILANINSFTATNNLLNGIIAVLEGEQPQPTFAIEPFLRLVLMILFIYELVLLCKLIVAWAKSGYVVEKQWFGNKKRVTRFLLSGLLNAGFFLGVLFYFSITPRALLSIQPDLGIFLIVGTIISLVKMGLKLVMVKS